MHLLATILDLLRYSLPTPGGAGVAVSLIAAGLLAARRQDLRSHPPGSPRWSEMLLFFAGPLVIVAFGAVEYGAEQGLRADRTPWRQVVLIALAIAQAALVLYLIHRHQARKAVVWSLGLLALLWTASSFLVAGMAIVDDWI